MDRGTPDNFQISNFPPFGEVSGDPLGVTDPQGTLIVIDTKADPIGALDSPFGGFPRSPAEIMRDRLADKGRNAFGLSYRHDETKAEQKRADNLREI